MNKNRVNSHLGNHTRRSPISFQDPTALTSLITRTLPPARDAKGTRLNSSPPHAFSLCAYLHASTSSEAKDSLIPFKLPVSVNSLPQHLDANTN